MKKKVAFFFFSAEGTICLSVHSFLSESCGISELFYIILQSCCLSLEVDIWHHTELSSVGISAGQEGLRFKNHG